MPRELGHTPTVQKDLTPVRKGPEKSSMSSTLEGLWVIIEDKVIWIAECETTFHDMKNHLASILMLASPQPGEEHFLYVATP